MKMTKQRRILLDILDRPDWHPTADEVYLAARERNPTISLATVYRNLDILAEKGWIRRLETGFRKKRYDGNPVPHHHIRCTRCGLIQDVPLSRNIDPPSWVMDMRGFVITGYLLEYLGVCPSCRLKVMRKAARSSEEKMPD